MKKTVHDHHTDYKEGEHASLESQLGSAPCRCKDTEEMLQLREAGDYESLMKLSALLCSAYRYKDALKTLRSAADLQPEEPGVFLRLGGALLTLGHFDDSREAYKTCLSLGGDPKSVSYPMAIWHFLQRQYKEASDHLHRALPADAEMQIALMYWNAISALRGGFPDDLLSLYDKDMDTGHHGAYKTGLEVLMGLRSAKEVLQSLSGEESDLNFVIKLYACVVFLEHSGEDVSDLRRELLQKTTVWPSIPYLAARRDQCFRNKKGCESHTL